MAYKYMGHSVTKEVWYDQCNLIQIYGTLSDRSIGHQTCCDQCDQRPISQPEHLLTSNHDPVNSLNIKSRHIKVHSTMIARHTQFYNA